MHASLVIGLVAVGALIIYYGRRIMALNTEQTTALLDAVSAIGVDLDELADRLANAAVADDPAVAAVIDSLRGYSGRIDSIASSGGTDVPPPAPPAGT